MMFWIYLYCGDFAHLSGSGDFIWWCILILWHVYFGDVWLISAATVDESYICMLFEFWCEDVTSISWIFMLFACIIALIEIGRYIHLLLKNNLIKGIILKWPQILCLWYMYVKWMWNVKISSHMYLIDVSIPFSVIWPKSLTGITRSRNFV